MGYAHKNLLENIKNQLINLNSQSKIDNFQIFYSNGIALPTDFISKNKTETTNFDKEFENRSPLAKNLSLYFAKTPLKKHSRIFFKKNDKSLTITFFKDYNLSNENSDEIKYKNKIVRIGLKYDPNGNLDSKCVKIEDNWYYTYGTI